MLAAARHGIGVEGADVSARFLHIIRGRVIFGAGRRAGKQTGLVADFETNDLAVRNLLGDPFGDFALSPAGGILRQVQADNQAPAGGLRGRRVELEISGGQRALALLGMRSRLGVPAIGILAVAAQAQHAGTKIAHHGEEARIGSAGFTQHVIELRVRGQIGRRTYVAARLR